MAERFLFQQRLRVPRLGFGICCDRECKHGLTREGFGIVRIGCGGYGNRKAPFSAAFFDTFAMMACKSGQTSEVGRMLILCCWDVSRRFGSGKRLEVGCPLDGPVFAMFRRGGDDSDWDWLG